ncbi:hypothetical protein WQ57_00595 [Mesobacillus campisalis]|uniref:Short-chain dehydrogenase n=1 Tax=Mesobacillus campisalis TaxID=1408103 RepID=A0A0M2T4V1_9BACI|nr:SDR family oxidoreductase [Mesobacillus campisalis]KKK39830.1 hypothetical protein WQ57_00595 [Mesobacillus campisalis]
MTLENKVAIITGGAGGIGSATADLYASQGAKVVIADTNEQAGKKLEGMIRKKNGEATFCKVDVSDYNSVKNLIDFTVEKYGSLDVLFNNAGIGIRKPFLELDLKSYHQVIEVNQHGVFYGIQTAAKKMVELKKKGVIINTSSINAFVAMADRFAYQVSKSAIKMMITSAAFELAPHGIRVVGIAPGSVNTDILQFHRKEGTLELARRGQMTNRLIEPEEIAQVVAFLGSDESSSINGSIVKVDDGALGFKFRFDQKQSK